jgi:transglutaminase-like putative cysteine protease
MHHRHVIRAAAGVLLAALLALSGCRQPEPRTSWFEGYQGVTGVTDAASPLVHPYDGLSLTEPAAAGVRADGFVRLRGSVTGADPSEEYSLVRVFPEADEDAVSYYWVRNQFTEDVWLRFGAGTYVIEMFKTLVSADRGGEGAITSWSYYSSPAYRITVENTRDEDGRYLYPSGPIQADDIDVANLALEHTAGIENDLDAARALHDAVVLLLSYDFESTVAGQRRKQDAASVLGAEVAVCEGYSALYSALLRAVGIPSAYVTGDAGGNHAWSRAFADGIWNFVDTTWDDPIVNGHSDYPGGENLRHDYFWKPAFADHTLEEIYDTRAAAPAADPLHDGGAIGPVEIPGYPVGWY